MAINFPSSPSLGDSHVSGGTTWVWNGSSWDGSTDPIDVIVDAQGDLIVGSADNTVARLAVGTDGYFLKANSGATNGIEWASIPTINNLDDIGDVTITSATSGDFLKWSGSAWVNDPVNLATDTTGDYVESLVAGTGVALSNNSGEGATPTIAIGQAVGTSDSPTFAGATLDAIQVGITGTNEIDTASGNLTIDSAGGTVTVDDDLVVSGNLTVNGTTTTIDTETINLADNIITLNSNETGTPSQNAGLEIERGTSANVAIRWNETSDKWELTEDGTNYSVVGTLGNIALGTDTTGNYVSDVSGGTGVTVSHTPGEGSTPTVSIGQAVGTSDSVTFSSVTANLTGDVYASNGSSKILEAGTDGTDATFTGSVTGNASTASALQTARTIELTGEVTGSVSFDGSGNVQISTTIGADTVALGTDTTGNYMTDVSAGSGISITHTPGEGSTATVSLNANVSDLGDATITSATSGDFLKWNGSAWVNDAIDLGTDTTGDYVESVTAGTGVTVTGGTGEGSTPTVAIGQAVGTSDSPSFAGLTVDTNTLYVNSSNNRVGIGTASPSYQVHVSNTGAHALLGLVRTDGVGTFIEAQTTRGAFGTIGADPLVLAYNSLAVIEIGAGGAITVNPDGASPFTLPTADGTSNQVLQTNGSGSVSWGTVAIPGSIALGTDTTGNYVNDVTAGTGVTVTHTPGEGSSPTVAIGQAVGTTDSPTFAGATLDAIQIGVTGANEIDTSSGNLTIDSAGGTVTVDDNLVVSGDLTVNGTTVTVNSTVTTLDDPVITLGGDSAPSTDDSKDRGVEFRWHDGSNAKVGFFGFDDSTGRFTFIPDSTNTSEVFSGTLGSVDVNDIYINGTGSTGTGGVVRATSPSLTTPDLGTPSAATLTNATGLPVATGISGLGTGVADFLATPSSANLATAVTDETGTGALVFATGPTLAGTPTAPTAAVGTSTTQIATTAFVDAEIGSQALLEADIAAKGDLVVGASAGTSAILTAGTNGYYLKANSSATYGVEWAEVTTGSAVTISDTAPGSSSSGDLWWESDTGKLKIYYNDGDSSQWVDAFVSATVSTGSSNLDGGRASSIYGGISSIDGGSV